MAGLVPLRGATFYGAAKAGLAMASEIARIELAREGIHVVTVYPGPVSSALERRARSQVPKTFASRAIPTGDPKALAAAIVRALAEGASRVLYPKIYHVAEMLPLARRFTERFSPSPRT
jgi:short-subunit dehydrogenase